MAPLPQTLSSFRYRDYRIVWVAGLFMSGAYWLQQIVIGWLMFDMTQSAILTGLALGLDSLPYLFLAPMGGIVADRWDRRHVIAISSTYMALITLGLAIIVSNGAVQTWHILTYALVIGISYPIMDPGWVSLMANSVPKKNILNAMALNAIVGNGTRLAFPPIGGLLIALYGAGPALILGSALYATSSAAFMTVTRYKVREQIGRRMSALKQFVEGVQYVRHQPVVLVLTLMNVLMPLIYLPSLNRMMPVYASDVFEIGPTGLGILMAAIGIGCTSGAIVLASIRMIRRRGKTVIVTIVFSGIIMLGFSLSNDLMLATTLLVLVSAISTIYWSLSEAIVLEITPDHIRGRVVSLAGIGMGLFPLGSMAFGSIAEFLGPQSATFVAGLVMTTCVFLLVAIFRGIWSFR